MKINQFVFLFISIIFLYSCSKKHYPRAIPAGPYSREDSAKMKKVEERAIAETNNPKELGNVLLDNIEEFSPILTRSQKNVSDTEKLIGAKFVGEPRDTLLERLNDIRGNLDSKNKEIKEKKDVVNSLLLALSVDSISKMKESFLKQAVSEYRTENPKAKRLPVDSLLENVSVLLIDSIEKISQALVQVKQTLKFLIIDVDFLAFQIRAIQDNFNLKENAWGVTSKSYFKSKEKTLSYDARKSMKEKLNRFYDTLFFAIEDLSKLAGDSVHYNIVVNLYIDGYSDSQKFKNKTSVASKELNYTLSQNRANYIDSLVLISFDERVKSLNVKNIDRIIPISHSVGHGEQLPNQSTKYNSSGKKDPNRRITLLRCTFYVEDK